MTPRSLVLRLECVVALCYARVALRVAPRRCLARALRGRSVRAATAGRSRQPHAGVVAVMTEIVESNLIATNCLHRSIALQSMLRRRGADAVLRIGARRERPHFPGHAWVEHDGIALNEPETLHERYAAMVLHER